MVPEYKNNSLGNTLKINPKPPHLKSKTLVSFKIYGGSKANNNLNLRHINANFPLFLLSL